MNSRRSSLTTRLPVRHGMTVGELALLYNAERKLGASLSVIRCRGWKRDDLLRSHRAGLDQSFAQHAQPDRGVALSGRGASRGDEPRHRPRDRHALRAHRRSWIDPAAFAAALSKGGGPGRELRSDLLHASRKRQYAGASDAADVQILVTNWDEFDPLKLGARSGAGAATGSIRAKWEPEGLNRLLADRATYDDILAGRPLVRSCRGGMPRCAEFQKVRSRYLLY